MRPTPALMLEKEDSDDTTSTSITARGRATRMVRRCPTLNLFINRPHWKARNCCLFGGQKTPPGSTTSAVESGTLASGRDSLAAVAAHRSDERRVGEEGGCWCAVYLCQDE